MRHAVAFAATLALAVLAIVVVPRRTQRIVERLHRALETDPGARLRFYRRYLASSLLVVAFAVVVVAVSGVPFAEAGVRWPRGEWAYASVLPLLGAIAGIVVVGFVSGQGRQAQTTPARVLLPVTRAERRLWLLVAIAVGLSEEAAYRGLFVLHLHALAPSLRLLPLAVASALVFGVGHRYQRWFGVVAAGLLGLAFGVTTVLTRSLLPAVVTHAYWDVLTGLRGVPAPGPDAG